MNGTELIAQERQRQIDAEGWTPEHDDGHVSAELTNAACAYAETAALQMYGDDEKPAIEIAPDCWPWHTEWWKPSPDPVHNLVKAGALIAAEVDRLQRIPKLEEDGGKLRDAVKRDKINDAKRVLREAADHNCFSCGDKGCILCDFTGHN
jgi:hypothetical protein